MGRRRDHSSCRLPDNTPQHQAGVADWMEAPHEMQGCAVAHVGICAAFHSHTSKACVGLKAARHTGSSMCSKFGQCNVPVPWMPSLHLSNKKRSGPAPDTFSAPLWPSCRPFYPPPPSQPPHKCIVSSCLANVERCREKRRRRLRVRRTALRLCCVELGNQGPGKPSQRRLLCGIVLPCPEIRSCTSRA